MFAFMTESIYFLERNIFSACLMPSTGIMFEVFVVKILILSVILVCFIDFVYYSHVYLNNFQQKPEVAVDIEA